MLWDMSNELGQTEKNGSLDSLFLPSLEFSIFATGPLGVLVSLLLVDIGLTFNADVSLTSQVNTSYNIAAFVFALLMEVLSVRFKHKTPQACAYACCSLGAFGKSMLISDKSCTLFSS
jgi:predicted MFS family arabinose efflux permease